MPGTETEDRQPKKKKEAQEKEQQTETATDEDEVGAKTETEPEPRERSASFYTEKRVFKCKHINLCLFFSIYFLNLNKGNYLVSKNMFYKLFLSSFHLSVH